ncbi:hypothetical protein BSL78_16811 [Apostichopus japonicus]|uniref:Uncharacterized protein n=1 Tax=Stichopus japonicus TaxID=307972 RepID=A0A2G8KEB1_STIJA|nr:hypothetical protein BSL78_16811 [Apostichopus japonicus]
MTRPQILLSDQLHQHILLQKSQQLVQDSQQNERTSGKTESFSRFGTTEVHPSEGRTTLFSTHDKTNGLTNDRTFTTEAAPTIEIGTFEATESTHDKTSDSPIRSITSAYPPTEESTIGTDSQQNERTSGKTESFSRFGTTEVHPSEGRTTLFSTHDKTNGLTNDRLLRQKLLQQLKWELLKQPSQLMTSLDSLYQINYISISSYRRVNNWYRQSAK